MFFLFFWLINNIIIFLFNFYDQTFLIVMSKQKTSAIILAAGKGTRMKSSRAKVLHEVFFRPMLHHVLDSVCALTPDKVIVVTGHQAEAVQLSCSDYDVEFALQEEQLGTGHAVLSAESHLGQSSGVVIILCGDTPLIRTETIKTMLCEHCASGHHLTVMTTVFEDPTNYGRIISDENGYVTAIVEEKDTSDEQKKICEVNAGIYCVNADFLFSALKHVGTDNMQGEVYLTDIVGLAHDAGQKVNKFVCRDNGEVLGVNSRHELAKAHVDLQKRVLNDHLTTGVTLTLPDTLTIAHTVSIGTDVLLEPNVYITGNTSIGAKTHIAPFCYIDNCRIGENVVVGAGAYLQDVNLADNEIVMPHSVMKG